MGFSFFNLFGRKKKVEEDSLDESVEISQGVKYPSIGDLQMQSDISYILQAINSKLDTLLAKVDNLSLRLNNIEQIIYNFLYRR